MTTAQPRADQEDSLTAHAFAKQSGLAPELVALFIPTTETSPGSTYRRDHLPHDVDRGLRRVLDL